MKVSGFTFVRNGILYDYPFREAIRSVLPLVDEMIVNVPSSDDDTYNAVCALDDPNSPKIKVFQSRWDGEVPSSGKILSHHTNLALERCSGDWCFYIQADEVIHEKDYDKIRRAMNDNLNDENIDGLLFDYLHFYGSYDCVATARNWYRNEVRIIRNGKDIVSYEDAQGFRFKTGKKLKKLNVAHTRASVYHYGWVRPLKYMRAKTIALDRLWHGDRRDEEGRKLEYRSRQYGLKPYKGTHPSVIKERVKSMDWDFEFSSSILSYREFKYWLSDVFESITGLRPFEYKGYRRIK